MNLKNILDRQKKFLEEGSLVNVKDRIKYLKILRNKMKEKQNDIIDGINEDLGKANYESYLTEYQVILREIEYFINNLYDLVRTRNKGTSLEIIPGVAYTIRKPYGKVLIQSPWNYPFQLAMSPVIGAIGGGNTVILKTSRKVPSINKVIGEILSSLPEELIFFANEYSHEDILNEEYDLYFFTGSKKIGQQIYKKAAERLVPVILELGGKSPCIVDESANIKDSAKKIAWGKFINSGQTCIAPDFVFVHKNIKKNLIEALKIEIEKRYNDENNMTNIITKEKTKELSIFIEDRKDIVGGEYNVNKRLFKPTLLTEASINDEIMIDEIFGPILPIIEYEDLDTIIKYINKKNSPLAIYIFSKNENNINKILNTVKFGGCCINDVIIHVSEKKIPFGGIGSSGIGNYHGKYSIDAFTHLGGVVKSPRGFSNPLRYPPYTNRKYRIIRRILS